MSVIEGSFREPGNSAVSERGSDRSQHSDRNALGFVIADLSRLWRAEFDKVANRQGLLLTAGEARILFYIARTGSIRQTMLAEAIGVETMTLSNYIDKLERKGLVRRLPDPSDRRAKLVEVRSEAHEVILKARNCARYVNNIARSAMSETDWATVLKLLTTARKAYSSDTVDF